MYITVQEALDLPNMQNAVLLAGKKGLSRKITSVNIMEIPDISEFIKSEELIITTMYPIHDDEEIQKTLIPKFAKKNVSALSIVPLSEERKIPSFMIEQADEYGFPLIQLPLRTSFNEILNPILEQILERKHIETEQLFRSRIINDLLQGNFSSPSRILTLGKYYGWNFSSSFIPAVLIFQNTVYQDTNHFLLQNFIQISHSFGIEDTIVANLDDGILLLFPCACEVDAITQKVYRILEYIFEKNVDSWIGIGCIIPDIIHLSRGVFQAHQAAELARKIPTLGRIVSFEKLGLYRILMDSADLEQTLANKTEFLQEKLGPILESDRTRKTDFLFTLQVYFKNNGNLRQSSKELFIHHNTMRYRLDQIEELLHIQLDDPEAKIELQIAIKLMELLC